MCDACDKTAEKVADRFYGQELTPETVIAIVDAFREEAAAEDEEQPGTDAPLIESASPDERVDEDDFLRTLVDAGLVTVIEMYPLGSRPFVLIEAREVEPGPDGGALASCMIRAGGGISERDALTLLRDGLKAAEAAQ